MRTYADSLLERKVNNIKQDLIKIKANQKYGINQNFSYTSNKLRLNSRNTYNSPYGDHEWEIFSLVKVTGKFEDKVIVPSLKFNAFDKNGNPAPIDPPIESEEDYYDNIFSGFTWGESTGWKDKGSEFYFVITYYLITKTSSNSNFYMDFWVEANDSCVIEEIKQLSRPH